MTASSWPPLSAAPLGRFEVSGCATGATLNWSLESIASPLGGGTPAVEPPSLTPSVGTRREERPRDAAREAVRGCSLCSL